MAVTAAQVVSEEPAANGRGGEQSSDEAMLRRSPGKIVSEWCIGGLMLAIATAAALFRVTNAGSRFTLWGEDGIIFTQQPRTSGIIRSYFTTYAQYFHFLPRTVGAIASSLPLGWTPYVFAGSAAIIAAASALVSWRALRAIGISPAGSMLVGFAVLLLPGGGFEVVNNVTNCQWYALAAVLVFVAAWIAGYRPPLLPCCVLLLIAGLTSPLVATTLPFVIVVALIRRRRIDYGVLASILVASTIQISAGIAHRHQSGRAHLTLGRIVHVYAFRVVGGAAVGDRFLYSYSRAFSAVAMTIIAAVALALLTYPIVRRWPLWLPALFLIVESAVLFLAPGFNRPDFLNASATTFVQIGNTKTIVVGRYMAVPAVALLAAAVILIDRRQTQGLGRVPVQYMTVAAFLAAALVLVANYPIRIERQPLATWRATVAAASKTCQNHPHTPVVIPNAPGGTWRVTLTCHQAFGS